MEKSENSSLPDVRDHKIYYTHILQLIRHGDHETLFFLFYCSNLIM